jgi:hypothetical protein
MILRRLIQIEKAMLVLASASWLIAIVQFTVETLRSHQTSPYLTIQFAISLLAVVGCIAWARSWPRWRLVFAGATGCYLLAFLLKYFLGRVSGFLEIMPFYQAIWWPIYSTWGLVVHFLASGDVAAGLALLFHEWFMPIFQSIVLAALVWPLTAGSRGDAPQAARA